MIDNTDPTQEMSADLDGDGYEESIVADTNADGYVDAVVSDIDGDGLADIGEYDTNYDGYTDVVAADTDYDGVADVAVVDTDIDGYADTVVTADGQVASLHETDTSGTDPYPTDASYDPTDAATGYDPAVAGSGELYDVPSGTGTSDGYTYQAQVSTDIYAHDQAQQTLEDAHTAETDAAIAVDSSASRTAYGS